MTLNEPAIAIEGCNALDNLVDNNKDNNCIVGESGGISAIIKMMENHACGRRGNKEAALSGCSVLCKLANNQVNKQMIIRQNGVVILEEMEQLNKKWKDKDLQQDVNKVLGLLRA